MPANMNIPQLIALTLLASNTTGCLFFGCGDDTTTTPVSVTDWNVDMDRYDAMRTASGSSADTDTGTDTGSVGDTPWEDRDELSRCRFACAYATGNLSAYADPANTYKTITIDTCELSIPTPDADGSLSCTATVTETTVCIGGRRPLGWLAATGPITCVQAQLDRMASMERVSITAFIELAAQLEARAAPAELVTRCRAAARDEARHVALLVELGAEVPDDAPEPASATTSLVEIALHNATEGCVTETWAALLARHQSEHASDPATRRAFATIASDEARHAQLAWDLHDWLCRQLDAASVARVEVARAKALAQLETIAIQQAMAVPSGVRQTLGLPEPREAAAHARDFGRRLTAAA